MTDAAHSSNTVSRFGLWLGPLVAFLLYAPTIGGTFLSDDFLVNTMLNHGIPTVNWGEIFADFTRSWAGLEGSHLYRPLVSLSWALTYSLGGMDPLPFHLTNVCVHTLATLACAILCARCSPSHASRAAMLGGLLFAMHPIAAEPTCWIASRTAGMQVMFSTAAMACFAGHLRVGGIGRLCATLTFFIIALLCKESAVVVPFSFVALDLLIHGLERRPGRWRVHAVMFAVLGGYFLLRLALLGTLIGDSVDALNSSIITNFRDKFTMLFAPVGNGLPEPWRYVAGVAVLIGSAALLLPGFARRSTRGLAILGLVWIALYLAPTYRLGVSPVDLGGSRMVYGATVILAVYVSAIAVRSATARSLAWATALLLTGLLALGSARMLQFLHAFDDMRHLQTNLAERARSVTPERPLVFVSVNAPSFGIPFLNCNALYGLAEVPVAAVDTPSISLGYVMQPVPHSEPLLYHSGAMRAMWEQGASLLDWVNYPVDHPVFNRTLGSDAPRVPLPRLTETDSGRFLAPTPINPWHVEVVEVEVEGACTGGRLEWLLSLANNVEKYSTVIPAPQFEDATTSATFSRGEPRGERTVFHIDVSTHLTFLAVLWAGGPLVGFQVDLDGGHAKVVDVRLRSRVAKLPLPNPLRDARIGLSDSVIVAPELPADADALNLYLIGPDTTVRMTGVRPGAVTISEELQRAIAIILRSSRQKRWYYYFEATGTKSYRSPVDWVRFDR